MNNQEFPLVSVITPSYNQADFIQETIDSVWAQDYPNLEHIVIDGGSTDGTVEILKKYTHLGERFRFISEPDHGQSDAINKGLKLANGEFIGWLNSDDTYLPGAISKAVDALREHSDWAVVYGNAYHVNQHNQILNPYPIKPFNRKHLFEFCIICQPAAFLRKDIFEAVGGVDETLHFCMDYDLWIRISKDYPIGYINEDLANSRLHPSCKSALRIVDTGLPEIIKTSMKHFGTVANDWLFHYLKHHSEIGGLWYLNLFKSNKLFGNTPKISRQNRYPDRWVPPRFHNTIQIHPQFPLHMLLIPGINDVFDDLQCTVFVNGLHTRSYPVAKGPFVLEIPIASKESECVVDIYSSKQIVPFDQGINEDTRAICFRVDDVIPLSSEEYKFYKEFQKGPPYVLNWLYRNRRPTPLL
ncbi:MAG: glycosyltransferase family 2 protein [Bacillota bacterium]